MHAPFPLRALLLALACSSLPAPSLAQAPPPVSPDGVARAVVDRAGLEGRVLWLDGTANLQRLSTREGVAAVLDRCVRARINTVVVDVKPLSGHVLYESRIAPKLREWRGLRYPPGYDLLRTTIEEGRKRGLKVYANINVFSDGHKLVRSGPIYEKPDQQSIVYDIERTVTTPRGDRKTLAVGTNRGPGPDQVVAYDAEYRSPRWIASDEAYAVVAADSVVRVGDARTQPAGGPQAPKEGYLLVGKGEGARWILQALQPGDVLSWTGVQKLTPIIDAPSETIAAFANPAHPGVREYLLRIVEEIAAGYEIDGIVFDRMRYSSLQTDFSDLSRQKFEEFLGRPLNRFPADIYSFDAVPGRPLVWGPYFREWLEWRARTIRSWLEEASRIVRERRPGAKIGAYVGSWYGSYYTVGVNWGSPELPPAFEWMNERYPSTGYAGLLDWITTGCYHPIARRDQARSAGLDESFTVQAAAEASTRAVGDQTFVYAGIYVLDYRGSRDAFREAIRAAREFSHGIMLFDLSQIEEYGWWSILEEELPEPRTAPHDVPELLAAVRALRRSLSGAAGPARPVTEPDRPGEVSLDGNAAPPGG